MLIDIAVKGLIENSYCNFFLKNWIFIYYKQKALFLLVPLLTSYFLSKSYSNSNSFRLVFSWLISKLYFSLLTFKLSLKNLWSLAREFRLLIFILISDVIWFIFTYCFPADSSILFLLFGLFSAINFVLWCVFLATSCEIFF